MAQGRLRFGTSSWSEKSWVGSFYPEGSRPAEFLSHYARVFDTVEVDATYYAIPDRRMVEGWARKTPEGFTIAAKFPRSVVHGGEGPRPDPAAVIARERVWDDTELFLERMSILRSRCGPLVLQFPYFNRGVFRERAPFLERLDAFLEALPDDFRYAVELRNKHWIDGDVLDLLRRHRAALVWVDIAYMPHPARLARGLDLVTTDFAYGRLIGDRKELDALTDRFDRIVIDRTRELQAWAALLRETLERVPETYVYANNHYAGHAPATIRELVAMVRGDTG